MKEILTALVIAAMTACASGHREPFGGDTPLVRDISPLYTFIRETARTSPSLRVTELGTIKHGDFRAPLLHAAWRPAVKDRARFRVLIGAGIHGNEPAGVEAAKRIIAGLAAGTSPLKKHDIDIIPVINPWGWAHDIRFNREGMDVNRDFHTPHSMEAKLVLDLIKDTEYDLVFDLHEDPDASGVYVYQYGRDSTDMLKKLIAGLKSLGYPVENDVNMIILKTEQGIIDAPLWGLWYMRLTDQLGMANYCRMNLCKEVFTLETPPLLPMGKRVAAQVRAMEFITGRVLE